MLFILTSFSIGCGVKQAPIRPSDLLVPSYIDEFVKDPETNAPIAPTLNK